MRPKFLKTPPRSGWSSKPFGRFISPRQSAFLAPNLMFLRRTRFTKRIFFFATRHPRTWSRAKDLQIRFDRCRCCRRFKAAEPLTSKESAEVAKAFEKIYRRGPLKWPLSCSKSTLASSLSALQVTPSRPWPRVYGRCHQRNRKPQNCYSTRVR